MIQKLLDESYWEEAPVVIRDYLNRAKIEYYVYITHPVSSFIDTLVRTHHQDLVNETFNLKQDPLDIVFSNMNLLGSRRITARQLKDLVLKEIGSESLRLSLLFGYLEIKTHKIKGVREKPSQWIRETVLCPQGHAVEMEKFFLKESNFQLLLDKIFEAQKESVSLGEKL